ncbi:MAG: hypothetical protein U0263_26460 [Polyangiaceae bacterium]
MQELKWTAVALVALGGLWLATPSSIPTAPALVGSNLGREAEALEAVVSAHPEDAPALLELVDHYLSHNAPGVAQSALERAPRRLWARPEVADARARTLWQLGFSQAALELQRRVLDACLETACSARLVGRAQHRERLLSELVRQGVEDPKDDPNRTLLAYRIAMREVTLDLR